VEGVGVGLAVHGDRSDASFAARADHAKRDLSSIGDENFFEHV
jgi:hypothetical protein